MPIVKNHRETIDILIGCLYTSRYGLTKVELREILNVDDKFLNTILSSGMFTENGKLITLESTIRKQYKSNKSDTYTTILIHYFQRQLDNIPEEDLTVEEFEIETIKNVNLSNRIVDELPRLLEQTGDLVGLRRCMTNLKFFNLIHTVKYTPELVGYWKTIGSDQVAILQFYLASFIEYQTENPLKIKQLVMYMKNVAGYFLKTGYYRETLYLYNNILDISTTNFGRHSNISLDAINELGRIHYRYIENDKALALWNEVYDVRKNLISSLTKPTDTQYQDMAISCNNYGLITERIDRYGDAVEYYNEAIDFYNKMETLPEGNLAITYHNLGLLYSKRYKYAEAERMYLKALEIKTNMYGESSVQLAMTFNNLALVYSHQYQHERAIEFYNKAINLREQIFGSEDTELALFYYNAGICEHKMGNHASALKYLNKSLTIRKSVFGEDHQSVKNVESWIDLIQ